MSQDGQLLSSIGAIDIHGRIRFGQSQLLSRLQRKLIVVAEVHFGNDKVAGAIQDRPHRRNLIGRQTLTDVGNDRDAASNGGFESDRATEFASAIEQFGTVFSQ